MLARLWWKDWRGFGPIWLILAVVAVLLQWLFLSVNDQDVKSGALTPLALIWALLYAFASGSAAFAGERESNTMDFLDALPVPRKALWLGKSTFAIASTFLLALGLLVLASMGTGKRDVESYGYPRLLGEFGTLLFEALAWGLLWSSILRNPLAAGALSVSSVGLVLVVSNILTIDDNFGRSTVFSLQSMPAQWAIAVGAWAASGVILTGVPRQFLRKRRVRVEILRRATPTLPETSVARSLAWETWREGRANWALVMTVGLFVPVITSLFGAHQDAVFTIGLAVVASLAAGVSVFGPENSAGTRRFLLNHGVPPGTVWGAKLLLWGLGMALFLTILMITTVPASSGLRFGPPTPTGLDSRAALTLAGIVSSAFAIGVLSGMVVRRRIMAAMVGVLALVALGPIQVGLATLGMIPAWSLFFSPILLLAVSRGWAGDWIADRPGSRPWAKLGLTLAVPFVGLTLAYVAYRGWSVPDIGPLSVLAPPTVVTLPPGGDASGDYRTAAAGIISVPGVRPVANGPSIRLSEFLDKDWNPDNSKAIVDYWARNKPAIEQARKASTKPGVTSPSPDTLFRFEADTTIADMIKLAELLALDSRERQSRGDLAGTWEDILAQFRMANQITTSTPMTYRYLMAENIHHRAVYLAIAWALDPKQTQESLQKAQADLLATPRGSALVGALVSESGLFDRTLAMSAEDLDRYLDPDLKSAGRSILGRLAFYYLVAPPWERERAKRIGRRIVAAQLPEVTREPYQRTRSFGQEYLGVEAQGTPLVRLVLPATEAWVGRLDHELAYRRGLDLVLAIRRWQLGHEGKYPEKLEALVPSELARLPLDPFSGQAFGYVMSDGSSVRAIQGGSPTGLPVVPTRPGQWLLYSVGPRRWATSVLPSRITSVQVIAPGYRGDESLVIPLP